MSNTVLSVTGKHIAYHSTPDDLYAALVEAFGETTSREHPETSWVSFGAGSVALTFWPEKVSA